MKATATTTTTLLALASTLVGAATACRQLSCAGDACEATPEQAAVRLCDALSGLQSGATGENVVGRDGCGWAPAPATGDAAALGCEAGMNRYTGTLVVWRAHDVVDDWSKVEGYTMYAADQKSNVGGCKVVKNVDC